MLSNDITPRDEATIRAEILREEKKFEEAFQNGSIFSTVKAIRKRIRALQNELNILVEEKKETSTSQK